jgi:magnesium transporter
MTDAADDGLEVTGEVFDFAAKTILPVTLAGLRDAVVANRYAWIDISYRDPASARALLSGRGVVDDDVLDAALSRDAATQLARYDDCLHLALTGCRLQGRSFTLERVDAIVTEAFLLTLHAGPVAFLDAVRKHHRADFQRFARSPSFLLYELWDHLIENYIAVQKRFEERVEEIQRGLDNEVTDATFSHVSELASDLLHLRKVVLPARGVLSELATRRSLFVSESTQGFLANMVGTVERVLQDLLVARDILSGSLNLYLSRVSHQTNLVMTRLTVVSMIFLPLSFLCGVYGMNLKDIPETTWEHGYATFWVICAVIAGGLVWFMRRNKLL